MEGNRNSKYNNRENGMKSKKKKKEDNNKRYYSFDRAFGCILRIVVSNV